MRRFFEQTGGDIRFAVRSLRRTPGFTAIVLVTLVAGITVVGTIFSYINAIFFGELPYKDSDRIVAVTQTRSEVRSFADVSPSIFDEIRRQSRSFQRISAYQTGSVRVGGGTAVQVRALAIDTAFFPLFDLRAAIGRLPTREEIAGRVPGVVISGALWQSAFASDPEILTRSISIGGDTHPIIGVVADFQFPWRTDVFLPLGDPAAADSTNPLAVIGKLRPGVSPSAAGAELAVLAARLNRIDPQTRKPLELLVRNEMLARRTLQFMPFPTLFLGAGLLVLLVACSNVASLTLARSAAQRTELAIRATLGASRGRLMRQALTESALLTITAAVIAAWLSLLLIKGILRLLPTEGFASWFRLTLDWRVFVICIVSGFLASIVSGLVPALAGSRFDLSHALKLGNATITPRDTGSRGVVIQLSVSFAFVVLCALMIRAQWALSRIDYGFPADRIALVYPSFDNDRFRGRTEQWRLAAQILERARAIPNAQVATRSAGGLFQQDTAMVDKSGVLLAWGSAAGTLTSTDWSAFTVSDEYFKVLGLRTIAGRAFGPADAAGAPPVLVIAAAAARRLWGNENPIGRTIQVGGRQATPATVVGVVEDVFERNPRGGGPVATTAVYLSSRQAVAYRPQFIGIWSGDPLTLRSRIIDVVRSADPRVIVLRETTLASMLDEALLVVRLMTGFLGGLGFTALALALVGVYGVASLGVVQRTREIGIRMALGATASSIVGVFQRDASRRLCVGLIIGLAFGVPGSLAMRGLMFGTSPLHVPTYLIVIGLFSFVTLLASYVPARRATRVDPLIALRSE